MARKTIDMSFKGATIQCIRAMDFYIVLSEKGYIDIDDARLEFSIEDTPDNRRNLEEMILRRDVYADSQNTLEHFGVFSDIVLVGLSDPHKHMLSKLVEWVVYDTKSAELLRGNAPLRIAIGTVTFLIFTDGEHLYNFFDNNTYKNHAFALDEKLKIRTSIYTVMLAVDVLCDNFSYNAVMESIEANPIQEGNAWKHTYLLLEVIKAYDINRARSEIYRLALDLAQNLCKYERDARNVINLFQVIRRKRLLNTDEVAEAIHFRKDHAEEDVTQCALSTILEDKAGFHHYFALLPNKEEFMEWPIYSLVQQQWPDIV